MSSNRFYSILQIWYPEEIQGVQQSMTIKAIEDWKAVRQREKELREHFLDFHSPFRGKLFQICIQKYLSDYERVLKKFDPKPGLGDIIYDHAQWFNTMKSKAIEPEEFMMATGKIIARRLIASETCNRNIIVGLELVTTKGVGFLPRDILRGPLENKNGKVKLTWDPLFEEGPILSKESDKK